MVEPQRPCCLDRPGLGDVRRKLARSKAIGRHEDIGLQFVELTAIGRGVVAADVGLELAA